MSDYRPKMIIPYGLPASGKSTYSLAWIAEDPDARVRVNYDDLRKGMFGEGWHWNRKDEDRMQAHARDIATRALQAGLSVIIDNTNLSTRVRVAWRILGEALGADVEEKAFKAPISVCIERDKRRGDARVGRAVIEMMALRAGLLDFHISKGGNVPLCIVDIDGTVADGTVRLRHLAGRHRPSCVNRAEAIWTHGKCSCGALHGTKANWPAYFEECDTDTPIAGMIEILARLATDHCMVFISGRPISSAGTKVGIITEDWLERFHLRVDALLLKQDGDHRPAVEFKSEMLALLPKERIHYVFDDDSRCVEMYRKQLPRALVLQGGDGDSN